MDKSAERKNVYKVYDQIADWYSKNRSHAIGEKNYLDEPMTFLPSEAEVLDLGCGNGKPMMEYLLQSGLKVTGVDASDKMLELARENFPEENFILEDMRKLKLGRKFNAIIAWHSFFHLPTADQPDMFSVFADHLHDRGILLFTSGTENGEAWGFIGGEDLYHASLDTSSYEALLLGNNFKVLKHQINDQSCGGANVWMAQYNS
ncbi:methyltransferase family protein [Pedobacter psychrotolerans]|uniref:Methyltransferase n=1 Tax=Pedobacter psychrotolerans TaxID=1843235 RepID=A0A4R2H9F4_9SPHI|nr:class I SAM-dependent methyltransferase [Pedobacter psychrotolerans]TCO23598.1 methyltransferase family protein [Pedobacter psychrotolerans]GGE61106.1 methyltransferase [Pedobacter psychrotolerans]